MNSVIIESATKEQVRYQKTPLKNNRHEELNASSVSSEEEMDTDISSKATGYASTLSTLLDYMSVDERVKLLPPSNLKTNAVLDLGGLSNERDTGGRSPASIDSSTPPLPKGLPHPTENDPLFPEDRTDPQPLASHPTNQPEMDDFMMPPVGNRDNFIPVGSESNIQTMGKNARSFRGVAVGGGGSGSPTPSLGTQLDANIHITISRTSCPLDIDTDTLLPMEERERFLPTGADSESLDKPISSSGSTNSDTEDNVQVNNVLPNQVLTGSINPPMESVLYPPQELRELGLTRLVDTDLEGATASCQADNNPVQRSTEDYMDIVERQKFIKTDLKVSFDASNDLPKNRESSTSQQPRFNSHLNFNQGLDNTNLAKSEPDLLLGHSLNFGICNPDLHQSIACTENLPPTEKDGLSDRRPNLDSDKSSKGAYSKNPQDFTNHSQPIILTEQSSSLGDFACPIEGEEDDTDELIKMASSVLIEPPIENSCDKSDQPSAKQMEFKSPAGMSDISSTPTDNPHLSQTNLNDNLSNATSNQLTESGRGTLGSSDVSSSPLNMGDNSKTGEDPNLNNQDTNSKNQPSSSDLNAVSSKSENVTENADEVQGLNTMISPESSQNSDKNSQIHGQGDDNSLKSTSVHLPDSENSSVSTDLYLPLSTAVMKGSIDNTTASEPNSARSYENDQSQDSDILGRQVNSLLCRTAYLEYRNQNARTTRNQNHETGLVAPRGASYLMPSPEVYKFDTSPLPAKSGYTEKEGLNYDQLEQDLTDLQNGLAQGMQLKNPILQDKDQGILSRSNDGIEHSANSPDVLQDSKLPTNLFRRTTQQADLLLGMDRILRRKEQAFDTHTASMSLPLFAGPLRNEAVQMTCQEDGTSLKTLSRYPLLANLEMVSLSPNMAIDNKAKQNSEETAFLLPNQVSECEGASSGVSLGNTLCSQPSPEVIDDLALRVERILSEEPLYDMHKINLLDKIRPKDGFFGKLSFDSSDQNSIKSENISETCSSRVELPKSTNSVNNHKNQEFKEQDSYFGNAEILENNSERICLGGSVASKESSENYQVSTVSDSSHSMGSLNKECSNEVPDSSVAQPSRDDIPTEGKASCLNPKPGNINNSNHGIIVDQNEGEQISLHFINKDEAVTEPVNFGHNETFPNPVNESANSTKFLEDDVRRCLDWSNMSTFSSPLIPVTQADNIQALAEMMECISDAESQNKPVPTATISDVPRNDLKRTSVFSESSITSSYVSSFSRSGSISGKSATSSGHAESDCHSSNTVASVCAVSAEKKTQESSNFNKNLSEQSNPRERHSASSSSGNSLVQNSSLRNLNQKSSANNVSNQRIDPSFCSEDIRRSDNNFTIQSSRKLDDDFYSSSKSNDGLPKSPYKLSLSESQPNFHPKKQIQRRNTNKSCSDISALHSEDPAPFLKSKDFTDSESLRRDLDALSNCRQIEKGFPTPPSLERKTPKEGGDIACQPTSKTFPSVSPSIVVSPLNNEPGSVGTVSGQGNCGSHIGGHSNHSNSKVSQFYESANSRGFVIGKTSSSSSSISSTNQSRNNSAQVQSPVSALKGKRHKKSGQMKSAEKLQTNVELKDTLDPQVDTTWPIHKEQSNGAEVNSLQSNTFQPSPIPPSDTRITSSSSGSNSSSPLGSAESAASHKTWTLRPYKPPGSREWYYTGYSSECLATGESGTTTLESADTGSDDAIGPQIPKEFLGTRADVPSRPGIYSRAINKKKIPVQEDNLYLSTILEKSFLDDRERSSRISEKRNSQCLYNVNGCSVKGSTVDHGNIPASGTKSLPTEFKSRNKDLGETFCTPRRIEHLVSKENNSARSLNQNTSVRPLDFENSETKALYDSCRLEVDNTETCREDQNYPEKIFANRSILDLPAKNQSSFESATTTVDTPSGFTTDPVTSGLRQFEPSFSSADSGQLQDISGVAGQCHPMVRYAPTGFWNSSCATMKDVPVMSDQTKSKASTTSTKTPEILPQRTERVVCSSKELDYLWSKFKQQEHSDRDSSLDSERLEHMHQLLKNPTHAHVHQSLEKIENSRLKQAKMAAHKMEEQKRALLRSKIQDESSSVLGSIYSNRDSSCNGTARRDGGSLSSRPSSSSDTVSSVSVERRSAQHREVQSQSVPRGSEAGIVDPIMARLRQKIDKQRKKCEQMKVRDKVSEQKLRKLTHILVNRQMNDLILAAEMSSLSTTSTASVTTASETVPKSLQPNACKNQPEISHRRANPVSKQQSDKSRQKDNHSPSRYTQNSKGQGKIKGSRSKQINQRGYQNQRHRADSPEIPFSEQHSDTDNSDLMQRSRPRRRDVATMVPSPKVVSTDTTSDSEDSCYIVKSSIGIQTSPPQEVHENSHRSNFLGANHLLENQSSRVNTMQNAGSTISPHKSSVEEVQVIPVPLMSTPKRYKNLANKALYKTSNNHWKKTSVDKANEAWFISLSDRSNTSTHSPQKHQHHQFKSSFASNPKAMGRENSNKKKNVKNQQSVIKKTIVHSHGPINHAAAPVHLGNGSLGLSENALRTLAITNEKVDDSENKLTLQEAFFNRMQSWISRSRERQKRISLAAEERRYQQQMELEREEMFLNRKPAGNNIVIHPFSDNLYKPKKRVLSKKEIRDLNERLYKKLPEVVEQKVLLHRAKQYRTNRIRSRIFSMHVQKSLLTKATCR